ncbi:C-GCAxxG-C-C family protein [Desulforegula conservatrix]|uniref:C-GCAxxG-C-C family protein n=1 Tax=Desulforegula conservatrix TaxID=153026 RepID=UPI00041C9445|nr:C-GCAxxG-C-C family protein [Desulforegula conservatrix]
MKNEEKALEIFKQGFSCSQAVLGVYCEELGLDTETALKLTDGFGGGMGRMGLTCGAVTGAFMAISLKHGRIKANDLDSKNKTNNLINEFVKKFEAIHGHIGCRELLGCSIGTKEGYEYAKKNNLFEKRCNQYVKDATKILGDIL